VHSMVVRDCVKRAPYGSTAEHRPRMVLIDVIMKDAQAQLGHAQIATTLGIYISPIPAHQRAAVKKPCGIGDDW
jgi:hypothetical protein